MFKYITHTANYAAQGTITASEFNVQYPPANMKHERLSKVWRSNGGVSAVDIIVDLGTPKAVNFVGIANHNLSPAAVVAVKGTTAPSFAGAEPYENLPWRAGSVFFIHPSTTAAFRYWVFRITDGANTYGFLEAGYAMVGLLTATPRGIAYEPGLIIDHISDVNVETSDAGAMFTDHITDLKRVTVTFTAMNDTEGNALLTLTSALKEETNPVFIIPRHDVYDGWYARLTTTPNERKQKYRSLGPLTFLEEGGGRIMGT